MLVRVTDRQAAYNIVDLGSGWGGMLVKLARAYPSARVRGYEISPFPFIFSRIVAFLLPGRLDVSREDFWAKDWSDFDIIFCYLSCYHMKRLKENAFKIKSGAIIVSCSFPIEGWVPKCVERVSVLGVDVPIFLYVNT